MAPLDLIRHKFSSKTLIDPIFGEATFIAMPRAPHKAYWECQWRFPVTSSVINIAMPGDENGPFPETRNFYTDLADRFHKHLLTAKPHLQKAFNAQYGIELPKDIFSVMTLSGFDLENPHTSPRRWEMSFTTRPHLKSRFFTIPFEGDTALPAIID